MDTLCTTFLHSVPASIKANPKKLWPRLKAHFVERTFYFGTKRRHYLEVTPENFVPLDKESLIEEVTVRGLLHEPKPTKIPTKHTPKSLSATAIERAEKAKIRRKLLEYLSTFRETRKIDWAGDLAGHFPGFAEVNHVPCLILHGPTLIEPKKGNPRPARRIAESLLDRDPEQIEFLWANLQRCRRLLLEGRYEPMQTLIFAGKAHDGKSLLVTEIIGPALGDRRVDASAYLTGESKFNADLVKCETWLMDDHTESQWHDLRFLESALKKISSNPDVRAEAKGVDAFNARDLFRVVVILFNLEGAGGAHLIPPISEDFKDKVQIFHTHRADLPTGSDQFMKIRKLIRPHLPALLYWLDNEFKPKAEILTGDRYQIKAYHNPEVCAHLDDHSPATQLLPLLERWMREAKLSEWLGNSTDLFTDLARDDAVSKTLTPICKNAKALGRAVTELCRRYPERFFNVGREHHSRYRILSEAAAEQFSKAIETANATAPAGNVVVAAKFEG